MSVPIDLALIIVLLVVGLGVALITSMVGLGGGIIFVPVLLLFFQFPVKNAIPISLLAMMGNTISCSIAYIIQRRINYKLAFLYDVMDPAGVYVGALLVTILSENVILGAIAGIIIVLGFTLVRKARSTNIKRGTSFDGQCLAEATEQGKKVEGQGDSENISPAPVDLARNVKISNIPAILTSSFGSGLVSGLAGLGGGITDTTTMILMGVPPRVAAPTSEFAMAFTNLIAVIVYTLMGNMVWEAAIPLMCGAIVGAQIGAHYSKKINSRNLIYILVGFAWFAAIRLLISAFTGF